MQDLNELLKKVNIPDKNNPGKDVAVDKYIIDPKDKPTAVIFGKFSPWTGPNGHGRLVKFAELKFGHGNYVILSPKRKGLDPKVDLFSGEQKEEIIKKANPGAKFITMEPDSPLNQFIALVGMGITRPVWVIGPDRAKEFSKFFIEYDKNNKPIVDPKDPNFGKGEYIFITGPRETSATLVRKALLDNSKEEFLKLTGYPEKTWELMRGMLRKNKIITEKTTSFKDFYFVEDSMNEGGLAGHMTHPYEVLSIDDFLDFYNKLLAGKLDATEKVDGANLFVGFDDGGNVVFARNKTEGASANIEKKFSLNHPGGDAFRAGFEAIKTAFGKLSDQEKKKYDLVNEDGTPKNFLNLEIIFGEIPNLIQYSDINNFIVFHSYQGTPEENYKPKPKNDALLSELAKKLGGVEVKSEVVDYIGDVRDPKKIVETKPSTWIFTGPIGVSTERIKAELSDVAKEFKNYDEVKQLKNWEKLDKEKQFELMKSLTAKIGSKVLVNLTSELRPGAKTDKERPGVEGLVVPFKGHLLKVTGDFAHLNQVLWEPLKGMDQNLKDLNGYILNDVLRVPNISSIPKTTWDAFEGNAKQFLLTRGDKKIYKGHPEEVTKRVDVQAVADKIEDAFRAIEKTYKDTSKDRKNIKQKDILKSLRIAGGRLKEFKDSLKKRMTRDELLQVFAKAMFSLT